MASFPLDNGSNETWGAELRAFFAQFFDLVSGLWKTKVIPGTALEDEAVGTAQLAPLSVTNGKINDIDWIKLNMAGSSISDLASKSHSLLGDIGVNTHAQLDTFVATQPNIVTKIYTSNYASFNLALAAATNKTLVVNNTSALTSDAVISTSVALEVEFGGTIAGNYGLTINGPLFAGRYTIFDPALTVIFGVGHTWIPQWWGAKADGTTDDQPATQKALNALEASGGGHVHFPLGVYYMTSVHDASQALAVDFTASPNTIPITLTGENAVLKANAINADKLFLNIAGKLDGSEANAVKDISVSGIVFLGSRIPNDTEISVFANTMLYFTNAKEVDVHDNVFKLSHGGGIYGTAPRRMQIHDNRFIDTCAGVQFSSGIDHLTIADNQFVCTKQADDQIAVFGGATTPGKHIIISGNLIDKGYNGVAGYGGSAGTNRGWAHGILFSDYIYDLNINGNTVENIYSSDAGDLAANTASLGMGAIVGAFATSNGGPIKITGNILRNCRFAVWSKGGYPTEITVSDNDISHMAETPIDVTAYSVVVQKNTINNFGDSSLTGLLGISATGINHARVDGNTLREFDVLYLLFVSMGATENTINVCHNTVYTPVEVTQAASAVGLLISSAAKSYITMLGNKIVYPNHVYSCQIGITASSIVNSSDNLFEGFASGGNAIFFQTNSPYILSAGNYEIPYGSSAAEQRNRGLKKPNNLNNQAVSVLEGDPAITAIPTTGTWVVGDIVRPYVATVGQPKGWVCTTAGTLPATGVLTSEGNL